jgi:hypothetical protein
MKEEHRLVIKVTPHLKSCQILGTRPKDRVFFYLWLKLESRARFRSSFFSHVTITFQTMLQTAPQQTTVVMET